MKLFGKVKEDEFSQVIDEAKETAEQRQEKQIEPVDEIEIHEHATAPKKRTKSHRDER